MTLLPGFNLSCARIVRRQRASARAGPAPHARQAQAYHTHGTIYVAGVGPHNHSFECLDRALARRAMCARCNTAPATATAATKTTSAAAATTTPPPTAATTQSVIP